jgi:hypothetical protein
VSSKFAVGASEAGASESNSKVSEDTAWWNEAVTRQVGAVGPVGRSKLGSRVGDSSEQIGTDDRANRSQGDDLTTAARRIQGFVFDGILEKSGQTFIAVSVTTGDWESVWFEIFFGTSHTSSKLQSTGGHRSKDSRIDFGNRSRI